MAPGRVRDVAVPDGGTTSAAYTRRLAARSGARWKRVLDVQAPYRWNLRRLLGERRTLDVGCGIGRNLAHLPAGSVGVDHNATSVQVCRDAGLRRVHRRRVPRAGGPARSSAGCWPRTWSSTCPRAGPPRVLAPYAPFLEPDAVVVLICPQERGFASDPTHTVFVDQAALAALAGELGLRVQRQYSFPLPRRAGSCSPTTSSSPSRADDRRGRAARPRCRGRARRAARRPPRVNEQDSVARVVREVRAAQPEAPVLVVDDGSTDATAERAAAAGAMVMRLPFNLGVGGAMRAGYRYAYERGFAAVVQVDADGQHNAAEIDQLLAVPDADVVIGSRFAGRGDYAVRGPRRWAMRLLSARSPASSAPR